MSQIKTILFVATLFTTTVYADPVTVPNTFTAGTPAKASEVNANFTALANAVNSAPKPLMVYDSAGKEVGQYHTENIYPAIMDVVLIKDAVGVFRIGIYSDGFASVGSGGEPYYYTSSDCSGEPLLDGGSYNFATEKAVLPWALYDGVSAIVLPTGINAFNTSIGSNKYLDVCVSYNIPVVKSVIRIGRKVDLSAFSPPFSVR